jgi:hypothetical protein
VGWRQWCRCQWGYPLSLEHLCWGEYHLLSSNFLLILSIQRYPKAARFKNKGWPHYDIMQSIMLLQLCTKGTNIFHPMQGTLSDVLSLPTMENNGNEDGGEVGGDDFVDWPPSDEETGCINFGSISTPVTLLMTPAPTPHSDVPAPTHSSHTLSPFLSSHAPSICHTQTKKFCTHSIWISFSLH